MSQSLHSESSISVIGGSLVGPLLSLLLEQSGYSNVHVYEATPEAVPQAGGVIGLDWVSLDMLDSVGVDQREIIPFESERVISIKVADRREVGRFYTLYPGRNTTWTLLHHALVSRLPKGTLHAGKRLIGMSENDGDQAVLQFADGEQVPSDFVAFADGRKSFGRKLLDPMRKLSYAGYVAARGQLEHPLDVHDFTRYEPTGLGQFNVFPILSANGIGLDWTLYINSGPDCFREWFGASPTARTFVLPSQFSEQARAAVDRHAEQILTPTAAELVHSTSIRMAAPVVDIAPPSQMVFPVVESGARAVLLGDALAPVRPHTAKGANLGFAQAASLAQVLRQHRKHGVNLDAALTDWEGRHLPQVAATIELGSQIAQRLGLGEAH